jgi:hypothetical protein
MSSPARETITHLELRLLRKAINVIEREDARAQTLKEELAAQRARQADYFYGLSVPKEQEVAA